ncbi:MAG: peptide-methionine (R)-S-oxide reductase MsrB [Fimbriimonadales bacterium]
MQTDQKWREQLTPEQYRILREKGTEPAFTGEYWDCHKAGVYQCAGCGAELFTSETKFDSGSGWPSFFDALNPEAIEVHDDHSFGMHRIEICCKACGGHLGHLFNDGPNPTGMRYCVNSASLQLREKTDD